MTIEQRIAELMQESEKFDEATKTEVPETILAAVTTETVAPIEEMKFDVSADVAALVEGEELSEEFKLKAATIFEAAVVSRVKEEKSKLDEQYIAAFEKQLEEAVATEVEGLIEKVDGYLSYMAEEWMNDNELALDRGIKTEIAENFMAKIKTVFEESYVEIPEDKVDVVAEMESAVTELETKLQESEVKNIELHKQIAGIQRKIAIDEATKNLTDVEADKFKSLAEEISFESSESFGSKLKVIRESYFAKKQPEVKTEFITESTQIAEDVVQPKSAVSPYTDFLSR